MDIYFQQNKEQYFLFVNNILVPVKIVHVYKQSFFPVQSPYCKKTEQDIITMLSGSFS